MGNLVRLALTSLAAAKLKDRVARTITYVVLVVAAGLIVVAGLGFLMSACWIWLAGLYSSLVASVVIGSILVVVGLAVYAYAVHASHRKPRPAMSSLPAATLEQLTLAPANGSRVLVAAMVVAGLGYVAGRAIARR